MPASFLSSQSVSSLFPKTFKTIKNITLVGEINEVKPNTFAGCEALESIIIPDGVCSIGENAFAECKKLKSISISQSVTTINGDAFVGCVSLKNVILPVKAFSLRNDLCKIVQNGWIFSNGMYQSNDINDKEATSMSLTIDGPYEFSFEWKVSSESSYDKLQWYLNDTLKNQISGTGLNWQKVTYSLPEGNHTIRWTYSKDGSSSYGDDCGWIKLPEMNADPFVMRTLFPDAYNEITNVVLIGDSDRIPEDAFAGCDSLESISIPDGVCGIGDHTFAGCSSLKSIEIPESVTNVVIESKHLMDVDGVVVAYEFNGTLDDGTGYAPTGNGSFAADRFGIANSAYYFNGQEQRFVNTQKIVEGTFSFAFWFRTDVEMSSTGSSDKSGSGDGNYILFPIHGGVKRGYGAMVGTDGIKVMAHGDSYIAPVITYSNSIGSGWNHAVVTVSDNTNVKLYLNGEYVATGTEPSATAIFRVDAGGNYGFYTGYLDDLVVCDRALDDAAVKELYSWTAASFAGCNGIVDVTMPGVILESMAEMFPNSYASVTNVVLTGGVAQIPAAFSGCEALESVTLAESGVMLALGGDNGWRFDENGVLQNGKITHNESSSMSMTVQGEGRLTYRWKASSEYYKTLISDYAYLVVDGVAKGTCESFVLGGAAIGGATDWQEVSIDIENESAHQIDWTFVKNDNDAGTVGEDCVWVDAIAYEPFIKVFFDIAGAEGTIPAFIKDVPGASVTLPTSNGFAKAKHTLTGWSDGVQTYEPGSEYQIGATNVVLAAVYSPNTLAAPIISSDDVASGGEITSASATVEISAEDETTVYYTLDGTDPTSESLLYGGAFEAEDLGLVTVKAIAVRENCFDSEVAEFSFTRRPYSAAECLNANGMMFTLSGDVEWSRVLDGDAHDGDAAMRSGAITDNQACFIETKVSGAGTISFWWKSSCEVIFNGMKFDYASFAVDGIERECLAGVGEWTNVSVEIAGSGEHTLRWVYQKDSSDKSGEDCAWLDEVVWTPAPDPIPELPSTATAEQVAAALSGSADAKLVANITDAAEYAAYRAWALGLEVVTAQEVKDSAYAWLSYALDTDALIAAAPKEGDLTIGGFTQGSSAGVFDLSVSISGITVGDNATAANLKKVFGVEGAGSLDESEFKEANVDIEFGKPEGGKVKIKATPKDPTAKQFFMRVRMKQ
ncbi:MAG: leucine-rich repeat protein [Kiritimatiellae bacterium]|nr:leucine-rich repeat protein [Kiritimatiellia bacterium]